jgi:hypothetical protein
MTKKNPITHEDQLIIDGFNKRFEEGLEALEKAKQLAIGDYLILYVTNDENKLILQRNSYGAPVKYKVVHTSKQGMPFMKKVNKRGEPVGHVYSCMGTLETDDFSAGKAFQFELDPDFADSLLLQDKYDPATLHKSKRDIWKAVTEHNKASKIPTSNFNDVVNFFTAVQVGDTLWVSNQSHYMVRDKNLLSAVDHNVKVKWRFRTRQKGPHIVVLTVADKNGKVLDITADFFYGKALYKERPRTYKELNI